MRDATRAEAVDLLAGSIYTDEEVAALLTAFAAAFLVVVGAACLVVWILVRVWRSRRARSMPDAVHRPGNRRRPVG